jgi:hypothetical protein
MGMDDCVMESIHDLLMSDSESISDSASSQGSYHPKITDDTRREATPRDAPQVPMTVPLMGGNRTLPHPTNWHGAVVDVVFPPHPCMNQLRERQQELKTVQLHLEEKCTALEHEIA